jgi:hypothetical protein
MAASLLTDVNESKESIMNSRIRIVKRNDLREPKQTAPDSKATELVREREVVAAVKSWIDELRSRQQPRLILPLPNKA